MEQIYQQMWADNLPKIKQGHIHIDSNIDNPIDNRKGITLRIRFEQPVRLAMAAFLEKTKAIAPLQYAYPDTDLHITALSIFSCQANFMLHQINLEDYKQLLSKALQRQPAFSLNFKGITLSPTGIVAKGYDASGTLNQIRNSIRAAFKQSALENTIDKRYVLQAAHCTLLRFKAPLQATNSFIDFVKQYQDFPFGTTKVSQLDLVYNDWYMKTDNVVVLARYSLRQ